MDDEARKGFHKALLGIDSRLKAKIDEALIDLRRLYEAMRVEDRDILKAWIDQLVPLQRSPVSNLIGRVEVELKYPIDSDEVVRVTGLPPLAVKNAIEHWERREQYTPTTFGELGLG